MAGLRRGRIVPDQGAGTVRGAGLRQTRVRRSHGVRERAFWALNRVLAIMNILGSGLRETPEGALPFFSAMKSTLFSRWPAGVAPSLRALLVCGLLSPLLGGNFLFAGTFTVVSANDDGPGSLRQAILDANAQPGPDTILFSIPGTGVQTIHLATVLPPLEGSVTLDGSSQPGFEASPLIELDGTLLNSSPENPMISVIAESAFKAIRCSGTLAVTGVFHVSGGPAELVGGLFLTPGSTLDAQGSNTSLAVSGPTQVDGANLIVREGALLELSQLTSYRQTQCSDWMWQANGPGSRLVLPSLGSLAGADHCGWQNIYALDGGRIELGAVTNIPDSFIHCFASGINSAVDLSGLLTFPGTQGTFFVEAQQGGAIQMPRLESAPRLKLWLSQGGTISAGALRELPASELRLFSPQTLDLPSLFNCDGAILSVSAGGILQLPQVQSYRSPQCGGWPWQVSDPGSRLTMPSLRTLSGTDPCGLLNIYAFNGGRIELGSVTNIPDSNVHFFARDPDSVIDLSSLPGYAGTNAMLFLEAENWGRILTSNLLNLNRAVLTIRTNGSISLVQLARLTFSSVIVDGTTVTLSGLLDHQGTTFTLLNGGQVFFSSFPDLVCLGVLAPPLDLPGQPMTVSWTVTNAGPVAATAPWEETLLLSDNSAGSNAISLLTLHVTDPIAAANAALRSATVALPTGLSGRYWLAVRADNSNHVPEGSGETNNLYVSPQSILVRAPFHRESWTTNSPMTTARQGHSLTLLSDGRVLAAGGYNMVSGRLQTAEIYDPATGQWVATGPMIEARSSHAAVLLLNGKIVVAGGWGADGQTIASTEIFDPLTGLWSGLPPMTTPRSRPSRTLLHDGRVLVVGGEDADGWPLASTELFDPSLGSWSSAGDLATGREEHTATLLPNGDVLVVGGSDGYEVLATAEVFAPASRSWTPNGAMSRAHTGHTATLLPNGEVLIAGGANDDDFPSIVERFDPITKAWTTAPGLSSGRCYHTTALLPSGMLFVSGGRTNWFTPGLAGAERYDPTTATVFPAPGGTPAREDGSATLLHNGKVLMTGGDARGSNGWTFLASTEFYEVDDTAWMPTAPLSAGARGGYTATLLPDGMVAVVGGGTRDVTNLTELYNPATATWSPTGPLNFPRMDHRATLLPSGKLLVSGGANEFGYPRGYPAAAELFDPSTGSWMATGVMTTPRVMHTATLLPNGKVLAAGGYYYGNGPVYIPDAEIYDPAKGTWTAVRPLATARYKHSATLLRNGKVLVAGGYNERDKRLASAELFDPVTKTWTPTGSLLAPHDLHTATLLPNGKVLVAGGLSTEGVTQRAELYDPVAGAWTETGRLNTPRHDQTATLLPNGKVLVAGGYQDSGDDSDPTASAEFYDPATGIWTPTASLILARYEIATVLLPNGKVLVTGGADASAELFEPGIGFNAAWQHQITGPVFVLELGSSLILTGSQFRGVSPGSSGTYLDSPGDHPVLQLRGLESGQTTFLEPVAWSTNRFASTPVWGLSPGWTMATLFVNGIPSAGFLFPIAVPAPTATTVTGALTNGLFRLSFTNRPGSLLGVLMTTNLALPVDDWVVVGTPAETATGQFEFIEPESIRQPQHFYRVKLDP